MIKLSPNDVKLVNIYPDMPITSINPPIRSTVRKVTKTVKDIKLCLIRKAMVEEILKNGKIVRLTLMNYDSDLNNVDSDANVHLKDAVANNTTATTVNEPVVTNTTPVVEEQPVEEVKEETEWDRAYKADLEGVDLATMTRKQRRVAEAQARAAADAATRADNIVTEEVTVETEDVTAPVTEEVVE